MAANITGDMPAPRSGRRRRGAVAETLRIAVIALVIALLFRSFLFQPFSIPSGSMEPTLVVGDYLFVSKYAYGYSRFSFPFAQPAFSGRILDRPPARGDVVVFRLPIDDSIDYVKRVIGLPGDRVQMIGGILHINGIPVPREAVGSYTSAEEGRPLTRYRETLPGGVVHDIIERSDGGFYDNTEEFLVPEGNYFVMGDNRDNSSDSRVSPDRGGVGFVPFENILGRAEVIFFSIDATAGSPWQFWKWPSAVDWGRLFTGL